jgi:hypothetical protein
VSRKGVVDLILGTTDSKANKGSTGSSGGMRSSWTKGMLDRILLAVGDGSDVLPNSDEFNVRKKKQGSPDIIVCIKNPAKIVCMTIYAALDLFYELHRDNWTTELAKAVKHKVRRLQTLHTVLHHNIVTASRHTTKEQEHEVTDMQ